MIISMAYTTPAVVARRKTITRRHWTPSHLQSFNKRPDAIHEAWSRQPQYGGVFIADIAPSEPAAPRSIRDDSVGNIYEAEGFAYLDDPQQTLYALTKEWWASGEICDEVKFSILVVDEEALKRFTRPAEIVKARASLIKHLGAEVLRQQ